MMGGDRSHFRFKDKKLETSFSPISHGCIKQAYVNVLIKQLKYILSIRKKTMYTTTYAVFSAKYLC